MNIRVKLSNKKPFGGGEYLEVKRDILILEKRIGTIFFSFNINNENHLNTTEDEFY
jgi:hypothetical protein